MTMNPPRLLLPVAAALSLVSPALAQEAAESAGGSQTFAIPVATFGDEPCPEAKGDEIVVCANRPEADRYRVPKELRGKDKEPVMGQSWASRVEGYDDIARQTRPDSCSPVGSYGFTGCAAAALREWFAARRSRGSAM